MERRDVASEEEEEYDSAEEEGSFSPSEDEAEGEADVGAEDGPNDLRAETDEAEGAQLAQGQGPGEEGAAEELEVEPAAGKEAAGANEALADDDADLEGALESVEEGMQALNVDDEVISQGGEEDPDDGQLGQDAPDQPAQQGGPQERQPQPYDVPTKGTFWLHDDRHGGGDSRRRPVRRKKIWDPTDDPWKHDMFDQLEAGRPDRYEEPRKGSDRRGRRGGQRSGARDYTRTGNFRAAASAEQAAVPDDEAPPGYEQPQFRQPHANGWAAAETPAAAAAGRSSGGGWWESGPAAAPEQPVIGDRGRGRNRGQRQSVGQAAPGGQWASDEVQVADSSGGGGWEDDSLAANSGATSRAQKPQLGSRTRRTGPSQRGLATAFANAARQQDLSSEAADGGQVGADEAPRTASVASAHSLNAGAQDFQPPAGSPTPQAGAVPMAVQQQPQAAGPAGAAPQMVFVQAPGTAQPGMQYQYIMPAASGGPSQPAPAGGAWVQMAAGTPMTGGFQMIPAEVFGSSGAQQAFIPGPMMMGMGYPLGMRPAMVKPVRRPITIQAPPDSQAAAGTDQSRMLNPSTSVAPSRPGGRRYSAMTGRLAEDGSAVRVASNA